MPVDRGETRHKITVEDNFSDNLHKWVAELAAAKAAWQDFKNNSGSTGLGLDAQAATAATNNLTQAMNKLVKAQEDQAFRAKAARIAAYDFKNGLTDSTTAATALGTVLGGALNGGLKLVASAFSGLSLIVRTAVLDSLKLNSVMESTGREIAAVALATGQFSDLSGKAVTGTQAITVAFGEGARQAKLLRAEMVNTSVTFEQLESSFKAAIGPGLASGMSLDQIRKISEGLSQASAIIGQNQHASLREQEGIFAGNASGRNVLANALQISNEDLAKAREAGTLVDLLNQKLAAFREVGELSGETWEGAFTRIQNAIERILLSGGQEFFERIKTEVIEILQAITDHEGQITGLVTRIFAGLDIGLATSKLVLVEFGREALGMFRLLKNEVDGLTDKVQTTYGQLRALASGDATSAAGLGAGLATRQGQRDSQNVANLAAFTGQGLTEKIGVLAERISGDLDTAWNGPNEKAKTFADLLREIPAIVSAGSVSFEKQGQIIQKLEADVRKAKEDLLTGTGGPSGSRGSTGADQRTIGAERKLQLDAEAKIGASVGEIQAQRAAAQTEIDRLGKEKAGIEIASIQRGADMATLSLKRLVTEGKIAAAARTVAEAEQAQLNVANLINQAAQFRVEELAKKEVQSIQDQLPLLQAQARAAQAVAAAKAQELTGRAGPSDVALAQAAGSLAEAQAKAAEDSAKFAREEAALVEVISRARGNELSVLKQQLTVLQEKNAAQRDIDAAKVSDAQTKLTHDQSIQSSPGGTALTDFMAQAQGNLDIYQATLGTLRSSVADFASFTTKAIGDAFNPKAGKKDIVAQFGQLLNQISNMIIQSMIKIAIQKAILGLGGLFGGGAGGGAADAAGAAAGGAAAFLGKAEGGFIPSGQFAASFAHFGPRARAFSLGGRPSGIPASDTVPAWLTPGEFVIKTPSVMQYGADIMNAINEGLVDPTSLRALAGPVSKRIRMPSAPAFASGGPVSPSQAGSSPGVHRAVVVPTEAHFDRMIAGGKPALMRFMKNNASEISSVLGKSRAT